MQIQEALIDISRAKMKIVKERALNIKIHSACVNAQETINTENEAFLGISRVLLYDFLKTLF